MSDATRRVISRRTVVRGTVATAWSAPLVQAVAAAPSYAAGSNSPNFATSSGSIAANRTTKTFTVAAKLTNTGAVSAAGLTATLNWAPKNSELDRVSAQGSQWTVGRVSAKSASLSTAATVPARTGSIDLAFTFTVKNGDTTGTASVNVMYGGSVVFSFGQSF